MARNKSLPTVIDATKVVPSQGLYGKPNGYDVQPGDNSKALGVIIQFNNLPVVDLNDSNAVKERIDLYMQMCYENDFKPTVSSLAAVLGFDRRSLIALVNDEHPGGAWKNLPTFSLLTIKKAYSSMEQLWENYMQNGKINPVSGIFLAKNNFNYVDKVEHVVEAKATLAEDEMENRYLSTLADDEL